MSCTLALLSRSHDDLVTIANADFLFSLPPAFCMKNNHRESRFGPHPLAVSRCLLKHLRSGESHPFRARIEAEVAKNGSHSNDILLASRLLLLSSEPPATALDGIMAPYLLLSLSHASSPTITRRGSSPLSLAISQTGDSASRAIGLRCFGGESRYLAPTRRSVAALIHSRSPVPQYAHQNSISNELVNH